MRKKIISIIVLIVLLTAMMAPAAGAISTSGHAYTVIGDSISAGFGLEENNSWGYANLNPDSDGRYIYYKVPAGAMLPNSFPTLVANSLGVDSGHYHNMSRCSFRTIEMRRIIEGKGSDFDNQMSQDSLSNEIMSYESCGMTTEELNYLYDNAADMIRDARLITVELGGNDIVNALSQNPNNLVAAYASAYSSFTDNYLKLIQKIYELNPDVTIVAVGLYNGFKNLQLTSALPVNVWQLMDACVYSFNRYIQNLPGISGNGAYDYLYADISDTEVYPLDGYLTDYLSNGQMDALNEEMRIKMHATENGHQYIAQQILNTLGSFDIWSENTNGLKFVDVTSPSQYYYYAAYWAERNGITAGTSANTFSPDKSVTRAEMITFIWRACGSPEPSTSGQVFSDVSTDAYYAKAVAWAKENTIAAGITNNQFGPDNYVTRAQAVTFIWRAVGSPSVAFASNPYTDVSTEDYFYDAVMWAVRNGVTTGTSDTTFSPELVCTRGMVVTFIWRVNGSPEE